MKQTVTTWRTLRAINQDAICLQIIKYEWDDEMADRHSYVLHLTPEPHWQEYSDGDVLPSTLDFTGLDMIRWFGVGKGFPAEYDPREALQRHIDERLEKAVSAIMDLHPAVELMEP